MVRSHYTGKMKGMKGKILKKLKSIPQVTYLKHGQIILFDTSSSPSPSPPSSPLRSPRQVLCDPPIPILQTIQEEEHQDPKPMTEFDDFQENKENIMPTGLTFRHPDPNSATLFDPNLLAAFQEAVSEHLRILKESKISIREDNREEEPPSKVARIEEKEKDPLDEFEEKPICNGRDSAVLYTTSLRGIRKTFEDCSRIRLLLENMRLVFVERDMSMHNEFREELWKILGFRAIPPRLFIKGRYIGGADEVLGLHEQGKLTPLVKEIARNQGVRNACEGCGGMRFRVCCKCNGARKLYVGEEERYVQCMECNENGLVVCSLCCLELIF